MSTTVPLQPQHRIWCGDTEHDRSKPCQIEHSRDSATAALTQRPGDDEPVITLMSGHHAALLLDVCEAQDVVLALTLLLERLARIGWAG